MRRYELMLLLRPDLEDDKLQGAVEKVTRAIVNAGGSLSKVSPWGKRRLAYAIGQFREASYFLIHFDIEPSQVRGIERGLLISEEILRHLVTVLGDRGAAIREEELAPAVPERAVDESQAEPRAFDDEDAEDEAEDVEEVEEVEDDLDAFDDLEDQDEEEEGTVEDEDGSRMASPVEKSARA